MLNVRSILFLLAGILYLLKNALHYSPLYINIVNDLMAIPVFLMVMEFLMQKIYGRKFQMNWKYILATVIVISVLFEGIFPLISKKSTGDPMDVLLYFTGGSLYYFLTIKKPSSLRNTQKIS